MATKRFYAVTLMFEEPRNAQRLVRASSKSQAVRHVADSLITAEVATQDDIIVAGMRAHLDIEDASAEEPEQPSAPEPEPAPSPGPSAESIPPELDRRVPRTVAQ